VVDHEVSPIKHLISLIGVVTLDDQLLPLINVLMVT
jgi:hypothetical protein